MKRWNVTKRRTNASSFEHKDISLMLFLNNNNTRKLHKHQRFFITQEKQKKELDNMLEYFDFQERRQAGSIERVDDARIPWSPRLVDKMTEGEEQQ